MAQPPKFSPQLKTNQDTYLNQLIEQVQPAFQAYGVELDFEGYDELLASYAKLNLSDANAAWELARDFNLWTNYLLECLGLTQKLLLDSETTKKEIMASVSIKQDGRNVSNGERLANMSDKVVLARRNRNAYKAFHDLLKSKLEILKQSHYFCKSTWEYNNEKELRRGRRA